MTGEAPLAGIRVLEIASVLAGPCAGALLQRLGAEVIKVESPRGGDPFRNWSVEGSPHFAQFNVGKRSIVVDLADDRGVKAIQSLVPTMDVLLHNSRPGRMEGLRLSGAECLAINPRLVYVGMSGFGSSGPLAARPAYDAIGQSMSGVLGLFAQHGRPFMGPNIGDMATGIIGASGALTGLVTAGRSGHGVVIETSMFEAMIALVADAFTQYATTGSPPDDDSRCRISQVFILPCNDGLYLAVQLSTSEKFFRNLLTALGRLDLADDARFATYQARIIHYPALRAQFEPIFGTKSREEWENCFVAADVPTSPVNDLGDVLQSEQVRVLDMFERGGSSVPLVKAPWTFDGARPPVDVSVPRLGEHTLAVLGEVLDPGDLAALHEAGVVRTEWDHENGPEPRKYKL